MPIQHIRVPPGLHSVLFELKPALLQPFSIFPLLLCEIVIQNDVMLLELLLASIQSKPGAQICAAQAPKCLCEAHLDDMQLCWP